MKKLFWVAVGIGIGVLATQQIDKLRRPAGARVAGAAAGQRSALDRVTDIVETASDAFRAGMSSRENELREALGLETAPRGRHA